LCLKRFPRCFRGCGGWKCRKRGEAIGMRSDGIGSSVVHGPDQVRCEVRGRLLGPKARSTCLLMPHASMSAIREPPISRSVSIGWCAGSVPAAETTRRSAAVPGAPAAGAAERSRSAGFPRCPGRCPRRPGSHDPSETGRIALPRAHSELSQRSAAHDRSEVTVCALPRALSRTSERSCAGVHGHVDAGVRSWCEPRGVDLITGRAAWARRSRHPAPDAGRAPRGGRAVGSGLPTCGRRTRSPHQPTGEGDATLTTVFPRVSPDNA
jgi:hypothetical protein